MIENEEIADEGVSFGQVEKRLSDMETLITTVLNK